MISSFILVTCVMIFKIDIECQPFFSTSYGAKVIERKTKICINDEREKPAQKDKHPEKKYRMIRLRQNKKISRKAK